MPQILLGLGAVCLLVAAVTFLVVAWAWLGVGGRTAVLVGFTATTATLAWWLGRRGLRTGAESLSAVAFGLLTLDVFGASDAGWLGDLSPAWVAGGVVAATALGVVALNRPRPPLVEEGPDGGPDPDVDAAPAVAATPSPLVIPQLAAAVGVMMLWSDLIDGDLLRDHFSVGATLAALSFAALGVLGSLWRVRTLPWLAVAGGGLWTIALVLEGLGTIDNDPTLNALWLQGHGVPLLVAGGLALTPSLFFRDPWVRIAGAGVASVLVSVAALVPAFDETATTLGLAAAVLLSAAALATVFAPRPWHLSVAPSTALPLAVTLVVALVQVVTSVERLFLAEPFSAGAGVALGRAAPGTDLAQPWMLPLLIGAVVVALVALTRVATPLLPEPGELLAEFWPACASLVLVTAALGVALYDVPLALVVGLLIAVALAGAATVRFLPATTGGRLAWAERTTWIMSGAAALLAVVFALPSDILTGLALLPVVAVSGLALVSEHTPSTRLTGEALLPLSLGGALVAGSSIAGIDGEWWAIPVLLAVGVLAIARPRPVLESSAAMTGFVAGVGSSVADGATLSTIAVLLTVAGALVTGSALIHPSRRMLAWPGGVLLAMATWARLLDLGVEEPEAYTLPSAAALIAVGLWRLRRDPQASTRFTLVPGLVLATVPSLLWAMIDPFGWRGVLLGVGCLALIGLGVAMRWSAPLLVGAGVGLVLTLRASEPILVATPPWLLIGLAGTVLTVVGVTWESRMRDLRTATEYVARLR